jgi:alpha-L-fucosidase 2
MPKPHQIFLKSGFLAAVLLLAMLRLSAQNPDLKLWYKQPSQKWTDALPIGNGRLGAMIYGDATNEHVQFNESTLWTGFPRDVARKDAVKYLQPIRKLLSEGKQKEAEDLADTHFMGKQMFEEGYDSLKNIWLKTARQNIAPAAAGFNDQNWKKIHLHAPDGWEKTGLKDLEGHDGTVWVRTSFTLPKTWEGKNMVLELGRIRDNDFTYLNGKQIGTSEGISKNRKYLIEASVLKPGKNELAIQVINFYDKGGLIGKKGAVNSFLLHPETETSAQPLVLDGDWKYWIQNDNPPPFPQYEASYQPFGDLFLHVQKQQSIQNYHRELDLSNAISKVSYTSNGVNFTREYLSSNHDQVLTVHLTASKPGSISLNALLGSPHKNALVKKIDNHTIALNLKVKDGVLTGANYLRAEVIHGEVRVLGDSISIKNADEVTLYLTAATSFKSYNDVSGNPDAICRQDLQNIQHKKYPEIKAAHVKEYQNLFNTYSVSLGGANHANLPIDERIRKFSDAADPALLALYVQFGRYLLISSSRPNSPLPASLQGIWNDLLTPSWGSKFTTNINLEMNYWPAESLNLSSCAQPLYNFVDVLAKAGQKTATENYGAPGWVLHHNTDIWAATAPINSPTHGIWVTGGAWLCEQLWEHYLFTQDKNFLQKQYPVMKAAAMFFDQFLVKDPKTGWLISTPSNSPEHGGLVAGPTMDQQIIRSLFQNCIAASEVLNTDEIFRKTLQEKYKQIAPNEIGKLGNLQEWLEDKEDTTEKHRHVSHLWGVYPGTDITWKEPKMMQAARQSLIYRGDEGTGWSIAWKVNLWARFKEGDHAMLMMDKLLSPAEGASGSERGGVYHNLFDAHPPFQIDGNFGGAAGLNEMLLQSQMGYLDLLPALPKALPSGAIKGICARGGFVLNFNWQNGQLKRVEVLSKIGNNCVLKYGEKQTSFATQKGKTYVFDGNLKQL